MKSKLFKISIAIIAFLQISNVAAQLVLPQPSPKASVMQTVGLTDITIDYSSPGVKGRVIWGDVVPYDKAWRAGANSATKITFSRDVTINGTAVPKGSYSIIMTPGRIDWTVHINKDAAASADAHKPELDIVKIKTSTITTSVAAADGVVSLIGSQISTERLTYNFSDFTNEEVTVNMLWEKIKISFTVKVDTEKQAVENIDKATNGVWGIYNNSARYYLDKKDYDKALGFVNQSLASSDQWFNNWVKAQILAGQGKNEEAYIHAAKAKELGDKASAGSFFFKDAVEKALVDWAAFAPKAPKKKGK
ncbi:MAG: DUF2911 domain-containing protein [Bacteroidia bacterium]